MAPPAVLGAGQRPRSLARSGQGGCCRSERGEDAAREAKALLNDLGYWVSRAGQGRETLQWEELNFLLFPSLSLSLRAGRNFIQREERGEEKKKKGKKAKKSNLNK